MKKPYLVWNAYEEMAAWPEAFATVAEALAAAERKKEMYRHQGYYSAECGKYKVPFDSLTFGVLWEGLDNEEVDALVFFVVDQRNQKKGGYVKRGAA